jgi:hypothetical protein
MNKRKVFFMKKLDTSDVALLRGAFCLLAGGRIDPGLYGDMPIPSHGEFVARCYGTFDVRISFGVTEHGYANCPKSAQLEVFVLGTNGERDVFIRFSAGSMRDDLVSPPMSIRVLPNRERNIAGGEFVKEKHDLALGIYEIVRGFIDRARGSLSRGIPYPVPAS